MTKHTQGNNPIKEELKEVQSYLKGFKSFDSLSPLAQRILKRRRG